MPVPASAGSISWPDGGETLFAYGTLQPGLAPTAMRDIVERLRPVARATVRGQLYDMGAYPGLVLDSGAGDVYGLVLQVPDDPVLWRRLDAYEGFVKDAPQRSLFRRVLCQVRFDDGTLAESWAYVYNGDVEAGRLIAVGRWTPHVPEVPMAKDATRPVIGITLSTGGRSPPRYELPIDYATSIERAGGLPWPLPYKTDLSLIPAIVDRLDGIVFSGGDDLDPTLYGETRHPEAEPIDPDRQRFELALISEVERRQMPALGICLGCQLMNVHRGGSLTQFLPDRKRDQPVEHRRLAPGDSTRRHPVRLEPQTKLAESIGKPEISVNTRHKQSINRLGRGLRVIAKAPDGVVEGIEDPSHPFFMAVQWHPENLSHEPEHLAPFKLLVEQARKKR